MNTSARLTLTLLVLGLAVGCDKPMNYLYYHPNPQKVNEVMPTKPLPAPADTPCPPKNESILVIDFKSGWWEGDGGTTFQSVQNFISNQCAKITIEYGHMTTVEDMNGVAALFPKQPFSAYDEIWILSGASSDGQDLRTDSDTFQRFLTGIVSSKANLYLGAGYGTDYHINAITTALGLGHLVTASTANDLVFINGNGTDIIQTQSTVSQFPAGHALFANITSLPDLVNVNGQTLIPDLLSANGVVPLLNSSAGNLEVGSVSLPNHQIILDMDLARLYQILNSDPNVRQYMINIATVLEK